MKYLSLFSGIGGFEKGIELALGNRAECIGYSEIDKYATQIYEKHFNHTNYGDITKIKEKELPDFDLLVGGFPCQAFSIAGKRKGFEDTRGTLFFDIARIIREKQPRLLLLENVKGLLSHDKGRTFYTIITTLDELGYDCQWQVLNSKNHGVPQNRERVFIIGHLRGTARPKVFPIGESHGELKKTDKENTSLSVPPITTQGGRNLRGGFIKTLNKPTHSNDRVYGTNGISPTLNTMQGGNRQPFVACKNLNGVVSCTHGKESKLDDRTLEGKTELRGEISCLRCLQEKKTKDRHTPQGRKLAQQQNRELTGAVSELPLQTSHSDKDLQIEELRQEDEKVWVLRKTQPKVQEMGESTISEEQSILRGSRIRRLTAVECERLQGFPDGWTEGVSDTQRYKCLGNAVSTPVVQAIMERLLL